MHTGHPDLRQAPSASSWSQDRRFKFIDFRVRWDGRINRNDLTDFFGISLPQASADLAKYCEAAPSNLVYDLSQKCYLRSPQFMPVYSRSSAQMYMSEMLALSAGILEPSSTFVGWKPPVGIAPAPVRSFDTEVLSVLVGAIKERKAMKVEYQGMRSPTPTTREISPTAIAYDGMRWHVRAYCHSRSAFRDFVIGRILKAEATQTTEWDTSKDEPWNRILVLRIGPHPSLSAGAKRAIELEFGMTGGIAEIECRQALLYYTIKRLRLDVLEADQRPEVRQIILVNREDIEPYLDAVTSG
jgi:hypothetical protein